MGAEIGPMIEPHHHEKDAPRFLAIVKSAAAGIAAASRPRRLYLIHIDNWFDHKWLDFAGQAVDGLGIWRHGEQLTIPPFVRNRVLDQRCWGFDRARQVFEAEEAPAIHVRTGGCRKPMQRVTHVVPGAALVWYTGNTATNRRGAIMAYVPDADGYLTWYVGLEGRNAWHVANAKGISWDGFAELLVPGKTED